MEGVKHGRKKVLQMGVTFRTETNMFIVPLRDMQRAKQPVPERKAGAEILVEMNGIARMVNLVMRRAQEYPPGQTGAGNPELRMLQMAPERHVGGPEQAGNC